MLVYWLLFAYCAAGALNESFRRAATSGSNVLLTLGGLAIALLIGLRYRVGADWDSYAFMFS